MKVTVRQEAGYELAAYGMSLSFMTEGTTYEEWWTPERFAKMQHTVKANAPRDLGHSKSLESILLWVEIVAPRYWWAEMDTYRLATKQSAGTMHTIQRKAVTPADFEEGTDLFMINRFNEILAEATENFTIKGRLKGEALQKVKNALPEGFLQTRLMCVSYKTMRNIILQRRPHALKQWQFFVREILDQVEHPELLPSLEE